MLFLFVKMMHFTMRRKDKRHFLSFTTTSLKGTFFLENDEFLQRFLKMAEKREGRRFLSWVIYRDGLRLIRFIVRCKELWTDAFYSNPTRLFGYTKRSPKRRPISPLVTSSFPSRLHGTIFQADTRSRNSIGHSIERLRPFQRIGRIRWGLNNRTL